MATSPRPSGTLLIRIGVGSLIGSPIERGISATPVEMLGSIFTNDLFASRRPGSP